MQLPHIHHHGYFEVHRHVKASADTISKAVDSLPVSFLFCRFHSFSHCRLQVNGPNLHFKSKIHVTEPTSLAPLVMSGTQPVTGSDGSHPSVPVKLSEPEQQRVQQADAKLQDYMKQKQSKVRS